jgi:hypothetical protein
MSFLSRLTSLFGGSEDARLQQGMDHAKAGRPEKALEIYNNLLQKTSSDVVRARTLFNRALVHSSLKNDDLAVKDLQDALASPNLPENVQSAARSQLARVKKRQE